MESIENQQWCLIKRPEGLVGEEHFARRSVAVPKLTKGQALVKNLYLSFDPTQRVWSAVDSYFPKVPLGAVMRSFGIGQVIASHHPRYKKGALIFGELGWQEYALLDVKRRELVKPVVIPGFLDPVRALALGITGITAYIGTRHLAKISAGSQVLVSGAAGAVGSIVCQLAKLQGAYVVGIAGGTDKCRFVMEKLHADFCIDYQAESLATAIPNAMANGIDLYFDNVGGEALECALENLNSFAHILLCGAISQYNNIREDGIANTAYSGLKNYIHLIGKSATMQGFLFTDYMSKATKGLMALNYLVESGKLLLELDMQHGFEAIPQTFQRLFTGANTGKQLLCLSTPPLPLQSSTLQACLFRLGGRFLGL